MRKNGNKSNVISLVNENLAVKIIDIVSWRCPLAFCATLIVTELIFFAIYKMDLEFVSTIIFFIIVFYILRLFWSIFGAALNPILFPEIPDEDEREIYVAQSLKNVNQVIIFIHETIKRFISYLRNSLHNPSLQIELCFFSILIILFVFFSPTRTFWFTFLAFHVCLLLLKLIPSKIAQKYIGLFEEEESESDQQKIKID